MKKFLLPLLIVWSSYALAGDAATGKKLFTERSCVTCHSAGSEGSSKTGPDLTGVVQKRKKAWLTKFLKDPTKMANDPIVKKLEAQYPSKMPNVGLSGSDIDSLIAFLTTAK
jgi:protein SCO1/2